MYFLVRRYNLYNIIALEYITNYILSLQAIIEMSSRYRVTITFINFYQTEIVHVVLVIGIGSVTDSFNLNRGSSSG